MEIRLIPTSSKNKYDLDKALILGGYFAGECYSKDGFSALEKEPIERTRGRINQTLGMGHQSPYEHTHVTMELLKTPKILAMLLNNEKQYITSEKSARYTKIEVGSTSLKEIKLYEKWTKILSDLIAKRYGDQFDEKKIDKLARENARYFISIFTKTQMIHTIPLAQINRIYAFAEKFMKDNKDALEGSFEKRLIPILEDFMKQLRKVNLIDDRFLKNEKERCFSLISDDVCRREEYFGDVYSINYKGSFAELAHAHRHRTLSYQMSFLDKFEVFVPPILKDKKDLIKEWHSDMKIVSDVFPQGQLVMINERGTYENLILKSKERLCSAVQLEIMQQTFKTLKRYSLELKKSGHYLKDDIKDYLHGSRCTSGHYKCLAPCKWAEGINLTRVI